RMVEDLVQPAVSGRYDDVTKVIVGSIERRDTDDVRESGERRCGDVRADGWAIEDLADGATVGRHYYMTESVIVSIERIETDDSVYSDNRRRQPDLVWLEEDLLDKSVGTPDEDVLIVVVGREERPDARDRRKGPEVGLSFSYQRIEEDFKHASFFSSHNSVSKLVGGGEIS